MDDAGSGSLVGGDRALAEVEAAGVVIVRDLIIAATAVATGRAVVTADARGFRDLPGVDVRVV